MLKFRWKPSCALATGTGLPAVTSRPAESTRHHCDVRGAKQDGRSWEVEGEVGAAAPLLERSTAERGHRGVDQARLSGHPPPPNEPRAPLP